MSRIPLKIYGAWYYKLNKKQLEILKSDKLKSAPYNGWKFLGMIPGEFTNPPTPKPAEMVEANVVLLGQDTACSCYVID